MSGLASGLGSVTLLLLCTSLAACSSSSTNPESNDGGTGASGGQGGGAGGSGAVGGGVGGGGVAGATGIPFPQTPVLDAFEYTGPQDATIWDQIGTGAAWLANGTLTSTNPDPVSLFTNATFGATQEAYMTLVDIPTSGAVHLLFSCAPCASSYVSYTATGMLHIGKETENGGCNHFDIAADPLTLTPGDQLGVRTRKDGKIEVYVNGSLFKIYDYIGVAGPIGIGANFVGSPSGTSVTIDNFGGGSLP